MQMPTNLPMAGPGCRGDRVYFRALPEARGTCTGNECSGRGGALEVVLDGTDRRVWVSPQDVDFEDPRRRLTGYHEGADDGCQNGADCGGLRP